MGPKKALFGARAILFALGLAPAAAVFANANQEIVGEITTVIGQGVVFSPAGVRQSLTRGDRVHSGDQIETADGGHVHIRFVDGGLVSVRPRSRLLIESYSNGNERERAAIKFRLEEGVVRSVTGEWGQASRDRFRLNTPIAAIGVKGTDFVVKVEGGNTFASVISGAIVMTPLAAGCANTLGPCLAAQAVTLTAEMQGKMLELLQRNNTAAPRLVPAVDLLARAAGSSDGMADAKHVSPSVTVADTRDKVKAGESQLLPMPVPAPVPVDDGRAALPKSAPMIWLHTTLFGSIPEGSISQRYDQALVAGRSLLASDLTYSLFRDETQVKSFQPLGTQASFRLESASATFVQPIGYGRPAESVQLSQGVLNADFAKAQFSTSMLMSSPTIGKESFVASGQISSQGLMINPNDTTQKMIGGFSTDGLQAGYAFEKKLANGTVSGLTLWGR